MSSISPNDKIRIEEIKESIEMVSDAIKGVEELMDKKRDDMIFLLSYCTDPAITTLTPLYCLVNGLGIQANALFSFRGELANMLSELRCFEHLGEDT